jgi:hypothetical protein
MKGRVNLGTIGDRASPEPNGLDISSTLTKTNFIGPNLV